MIFISFHISFTNKIDNKYIKYCRSTTAEENMCKTIQAGSGDFKMNTELAGTASAEDSEPWCESILISFNIKQPLWYGDNYFQVDYVGQKCNATWTRKWNDPPPVM